MLTLSSPWSTFNKMLKVLFERDPSITVGDVYETDEKSKANYGMDIEVRNHEKFLALEKLLPKVKKFGNVTMQIVLFDEENNNLNTVDDEIASFVTVFKDNPIFRNAVISTDIAQTKHGFVLFEPEVIQFFDDVLFDYNGNWSGLAEEIAREVFDTGINIHFCTAQVKDK